jgi:hypothetical protein
MSTHILTEAELASRLGSPPQYGNTAVDVLGTCALIAEATDQWNADTVEAFQERVGVGEKVWNRLLAIHRSERWAQVPCEELPCNYTALYALTTLEEEEWEELQAAKRIKPDLSSRKVNSWKMRRMAAKDGFDRQVPMLLGFRSEAPKLEVATAIKELVECARANGMVLMSAVNASKDFADRATPEETVKRITNQLMTLCEPLVADAGKVTRESLGIESAEDLVNSAMRDFLKFINRAAGSNAAALEHYGEQYCLKYALEYNKEENSRANRSNYKKKLVELSEGDGDSSITKAARRALISFIL